jgi:hypothetical protein
MSRLACFTLALAAAACSSDPPNAPTCPARAAFHLVVRASDGPLPVETAIKIEHGGASEEEFRLDRPDAKPEVLYCTPGRADAAPDKVVEVACDLWTQAETRVTVTAPGYTELVTNLEVESSGRCIETSRVELALERGSQ